MAEWILIAMLVAACAAVSIYVYRKLERSNMWIDPRMDTLSFETMPERRQKQVLADLGIE